MRQQESGTRVAAIAMVGMVIFGGLASAGADEPVEPVEPPSIVLILADDLGWTDLACYGSDYHQTPHIDRLAQNGMRFTAAYGSPNCAPMRASLMSGQYTPRHGIYTVGTGARGQERHRDLIPAETETVLPLDIQTVAETLQSAGYFTAHVGKWHLGQPPQAGPEQQGFDVNVAGYRAGHPAAGYFSPYRNPALSDGPEGEYLTHRLTDEAVEIIRDRAGEPFFLYLPHYSPHTPIQAPEEDVERYRQRERGEHHDHPTYAAMIESVDRSVGRMMQALEEAGAAENTIVIFYSDNGQHGNFSSAHPLRGAKGMLHEGGIRVPLIVRWPGVVEPGTTTDEPVQHVDFYPTLTEMAGADVPDDHVLDGLSLMPLLRSGGEATLDREAIYWHFPGYLQGYGRGDVQAGRWRVTPATAMRAGDWKLLEFFEDGRLELYNLADDIAEEHNLADEHPGKRDELHERMQRWRQRLDAPMPQSVDPENDRSS